MHITLLNPVLDFKKPPQGDKSTMRTYAFDDCSGGIGKILLPHSWLWGNLFSFQIQEPSGGYCHYRVAKAVGSDSPYSKQNAKHSQGKTGGFGEKAK